MRNNLTPAVTQRIKALSWAWKSSAAWKRYDAEMTDNPEEALACRREAMAYEACAYNLDSWVRE